MGMPEVCFTAYTAPLDELIFNHNSFCGIASSVWPELCMTRGYCIIPRVRHSLLLNIHSMCSATRTFSLRSRCNPYYDVRSDGESDLLPYRVAKIV